MKKGMKKGINTVDALMAILLILFIISWLQNYHVLTLKDVNEFGTQLQVEMLAMKFGSEMNSFYATRSGDNDFLDFGYDPVKIEIFGQTFETSITKELGENKIIVILRSVETGKTYTAEYPVSKNIKSMEIG